MIKEKIINWVEDIAIRAIKRYLDDNYVVCEESKCLVLKSEAVRGADKIRVKQNGFWGFSFMSSFAVEKEIYTPYFSPKFAPKKK